jgi:DNA-binding GntR family transcriptional regulator
VSRPLTRTVLREQVKDLVLERILDGTYRPGERLVETRIAQELGTSQAPVREALRDLELLRLIESEPFRGARVREVRPEELAEMYPVRAALEEVAALTACRRPAEERSALAAQLEAELKAMRAAARRGDLHAQVEHDAAFHRAIVEASGNQTLIEVWSSLGIHARTLATALTAGIEPKEIVEMHQPIVDAMKNGKPENVARILRRHVEQFGELLLKGAQEQ